MAITLSDVYYPTPHYYHTISLTWSASTGAIHYRLFYSSSSGIDENDPGIKIKKFTSFNKTNLISNTTYYFRVYSYGPSGTIESIIQEEIDEGNKIIEISNEISVSTANGSGVDDISDDLLFDTNLLGGYSSGGEILFLYVNADPSNSTIYFTESFSPSAFENFLYDPNIPNTIPSTALPCRAYVYNPDPEISGAFMIQVNMSPAVPIGVPPPPPSIQEVPLSVPIGGMIKCFMVDPDGLLTGGLITNSNFIYPPSVAIAAYPTGRIGLYPYIVLDPITGIIPVVSPILPDPRMLQTMIFCRIKDTYTEGNGKILNPIKFIFHPIKQIIGNKIYIRNMNDPSGSEWKVQVVETTTPPDGTTVWSDWDCDNDYIEIPSEGKFVYSGYVRTVNIANNNIVSSSHLITHTSGFVPF